MIKRNLILTVNGEESKLNNIISIYQGDSGIVLSFEIIGLNYEFDKATTNIIDKYNPVSCSVIFKKPNGSRYKVNKTSVNNGQLIFTITSDMTDQFEEIGIYYIQFRLYDVHDHVLTIPPVSFTVKPLINNPAVTDDSVTDGDNTSGNEPGDVVEPDYGNDLDNKIYNIKEWKENELIKAYDLNRMEEAINYAIKNADYKLINDLTENKTNTWSSKKIYDSINNKRYLIPLTQEEYDSLEEKEENVLYIII